MKYVCVMPWMWRRFRNKCLAGCRLEVLEVNNSENNLGIMRSHNLGVDEMHRQQADWLIIMSAAVRFGPEGGRDFVKALETTHAEAHVVNAVGLFGWHLMAFRRDVIEAVGRFDENFTPYGLDDNDLSIRIHKAMPEANWWGVTGLEVADTMMGHSIKLAGLDTPYDPKLRYFTEKWGAGPGPPFEAYYDHPWNDETNPIGFWPPINGARWDGPAPEETP